MFYEHRVDCSSGIAEKMKLSVSVSVFLISLQAPPGGNYIISVPGIIPVCHC